MVILELSPRSKSNLLTILNNFSKITIGVMFTFRCGTFTFTPDIGICNIPGNIHAPYPGCCSAPGPCSKLAS